MVCYARLYGRDVEPHRARLWNDLTNLNNRTVVLLPEWPVIRHRYHQRGDEIQDIDSLRCVYDLFREEAEKIKSLPSVTVIEDGFMDESCLASNCLEKIQSLERQCPDSMGAFIENTVRGSGRHEISPLKISLLFDEIENDSDKDIMNHPPEKAYYQNILERTLSNIEDELAGRNEYGKRQKPDLSRRFIFTQDSCISLIHTMLRDDTVNMHAVCRSSDVGNTFPYDLKFLIYLLSIVRNLLSPSLKCVLNCTLNSAHIID